MKVVLLRIFSNIAGISAFLWVAIRSFTGSRRFLSLRQTDNSVQVSEPSLVLPVWGYFVLEFDAVILGRYHIRWKQYVLLLNCNCTCLLNLYLSWCQQHCSSVPSGLQPPNIDQTSLFWMPFASLSSLRNLIGRGGLPVAKPNVQVAHSHVSNGFINVTRFFSE